MKISSSLALAALVMSLGFLPGCGGSGGQGSGPAAAPRAGGDANVATVGDRTITSAELEEHVKSKLVEIETQRYDTLREGLDEMIAEELVKQEASARGISPDALEKQEVS